MLSRRETRNERKGGYWARRVEEGRKGEREKIEEKSARKREVA